MDAKKESLHRRLAAATLERAQALWDMGNTEQAVKDFQEAYSSAPDLASTSFSKVVYQIGIQKQETGDLEGALTDFQSAKALASEGDWNAEIQQAIEALELRLHPPAPQPVVMTECPKCGGHLEPGWSFCPNCTTNLKSPKSMGANTCPQCGKQIETEWEYCPFCTTSLEARTHIGAVNKIDEIQPSLGVEKQLQARGQITQSTSQEAGKKPISPQTPNRSAGVFLIITGGLSCLFGIFLIVNAPSWYADGVCTAIPFIISGGLELEEGLQKYTGSSSVNDEVATSTINHSRSIPDYLSESESSARAGDLNRAAQVLEAAIRDEPLSGPIIAGDPDDKPPRGYALLLQLAAESGKKELALEYYKRMLKLNPIMPENAKKAAKKAGIL